MAQLKPELVSPAGDWESLRAAAANGADAVYFGLNEFSARQRAVNFTPEELPRVIEYLHARNVRGYVTLNVLAFSDELERVAELVRAVADAGADAVIVQDLGVMRLIKRMAPDLSIHASTQMTLTEPRGIALVREMGVERVILARELSLGQIKQIATQTTLRLEVFVHGALCVSYSGQCLASGSLGGRSANRGECAQPCRLPYQMIVDGRRLDLGDRKYLLSPHDLAAYDRIPDLLAAGVGAFKIEGRLKNARYVALTTSIYRAALDAAQAGKPFSLSREQERALKQSFSRGFTHGYLDGIHRGTLVDGRSPASRGLRMGAVTHKTSRGVVVALEETTPLNLGDGVVFESSQDRIEAEGGRVLSVRPASTRGSHSSPTIEVAFRREDVNLSAIAVGDIMWKTDDPAIRKRIEQSYARDSLRIKPRLLDICVRAAAGEPLKIIVSDDEGRQISVSWEGPLMPAQKHPLSLDLVREQFGRLGGTPFGIGSISAERLDPVMVPKSVLNDLRRQAVDGLVRLRKAQSRHRIAELNALDAIRREIRLRPNVAKENADHLYVLVRTMPQLDALLKWKPPPPYRRPSLIYCDFDDTTLHEQAVAQCRAAGMPVGIATPRIIKPSDEDIFEAIARCEPDVVLVRNLAAVSFFRSRGDACVASTRQPALTGDFSLNVANEITCDMLATLGLTHVTPSYDLNWKRLSSMLSNTPPGLFEVVIHHHMPMFYMEHCPLAAFLGKSVTGTRPDGACHTFSQLCRKHRVELKDRVGACHPVVGNFAHECRTTVFNGTAHSAREYMDRMRRLGVRHFRVELLHETPDEAIELLPEISDRSV